VFLILALQAAATGDLTMQMALQAVLAAAAVIKIPLVEQEILAAILQSKAMLVEEEQQFMVAVMRQKWVGKEAALEL
tara:strand:- start:442 stop:672 length:231 start_codon:yes stop_codon:yes gene_type:complete